MITTGNVVVGGRDGEEGNNVNNVVGGGRDGEEGNNVNSVGGGGGGDGGGGDGGSHHLTAGGLKKGPWTAAEDAMLVEYVRKYGEGNWNAVQRHSGLARCGKSCRLRWANHLRPNLRKGAFSPEEERLIVELHAKLGNKWARMAALLPGRTDNEIKNYWNTRVKRHQRQGLPLYPPDLLPQNNQQNYNHHHHQNHYNHQFSSAPTTPTSSFTFQTHLQSPTAPLLHTPPHTPTPPPLSPLSSPSTTTTTTTNNNNNNNTLPLFDFALPKAPPILQTPLRFKRYNSTGNISDSGNGNAHLSFPFSPLSISPATGLLGGSDGSSSEFHKEMARENQKMCSLFAAVTQNQMQLELPSNQYLQSTLPQNNWNSGFGVGFDSASNVSKFGGRKMNKRRYSEIGGLELMESGNGFLEDFFAEAKTSAANGVSSMEQDYLFFDEQKPKLLGFDEFSKSWDPSNALTLSSELKLNMEALGRQDTMPEDLTKLLNTLPTSMPHDLYSDSGNISNRQSSVVTEDSIDYEMQQIALLFPTTADQSRTLGSWDTLPRIC